METTGLAPTSEIVQLAARSADNKVFNHFAMPEKGISAGARRATGLSVDCISGRSQLLHNGKPVDSISESALLGEFAQWLQELGLCPGSVVLAAHNSLAFDSRVLVNALARAKRDMSRHVAGFTDTLLAFREQHPNLKGQHSLSSLAEHFEAGPFTAHDANEDVKILKDLTAKHLKQSSVETSSFSLASALEHNSGLFKTAELTKTLQPVVGAKKLSRSMAHKAAASGLALCHVRLAFERNGRDGVSSLFREKKDGCIRVTASKKIVESVCSYFEEKSVSA